MLQKRPLYASALLKSRSENVNSLSLNDKIHIHQRVDSLLLPLFHEEFLEIKSKGASHGKHHHGSRFCAYSIKNHLKSCRCFKFFFHDQNPELLSDVLCVK